MVVKTGEMRQGTCAIRTLASLVGALRTWGVDVAAILATAGLSPDQVEDHERRISLSQYRRVWQAARETTGDDAIGLHVVDCFDPQNVLSAFVYLASSSATAREAFDRVRPFMHLAHDAIDVSLHEQAGQTICKAGFRGWEDDRTLNEYFIGLILKIAPAVAGPDEPLSAWFSHPPPPYAKEYAPILGVEVRFDAPFNAIVGSAENLDRPLPHADAILCSILERQALARPGASVGEVAYALGFSDTSAFHKAFRRWTGKRPSDIAGASLPAAVEDSVR